MPAERVTDGVVARNGQPRTLGWIDGEVYKTTRTRSKHLYRKYQSYGIDKGILEALVRRGVTVVQVNEILPRNSFNVPLDYWLANGIKVEYGGNVQLHVPIATMAIINAVRVQRR